MARVCNFFYFLKYITKRSLVALIFIFCAAILVWNGYFKHSSNESVIVSNSVGNHVQKHRIIQRNVNISNSSLNTWEMPAILKKNTVFVLMYLTNVNNNIDLEKKFKVCVKSMSDHSSVTIVLFLVGDSDSYSIAMRVINNLKWRNIELHLINFDKISKHMDVKIRSLQEIFSSTSHSYYKKFIFYFSIVVHYLAPQSLYKLIILDADIKFMNDIKCLNDMFKNFSSSNIFGMAYENQPVYHNILSLYRSQNNGTNVGSPPFKGNPGFNSGVMLVDLHKLRLSDRYEALLNTNTLRHLLDEYYFHGHLGDQDFYTLISLDNEDLFYILPCTWNRQLCQWWRDKGYTETFDQYFACEGAVQIYHGNCNTPIPET